MNNVVYVLICAFFIIFGIVDLIRFFIFSGLKTLKDQFSIFIIIPVKGHQENMEYLIRNAVAQLKWTSHSCESKVICLDLGMDDETKKICEIFCSDYSCLELRKVNIENNELG